jgi:DNA-binding transcriptional MerR regulator
MSRPEDELPALPDRLYFKIGEVSRLVGVRTSVIRYWETEFPQVRPEKGQSGHRVYRRADVEALRRIRRLVHDRGYTIAGARALLAEGEASVQVVLDAQVRAHRAGQALARPIGALEEAVGPEEGLRGELEHARAEIAALRAALDQMRRELARATTKFAMSVDNSRSSD